MTVSIAKREKGCVTLSDGRRVRRWGSYGRWAVEEQRADGEWEMIPYTDEATLRDALKAAGVEA